jgi:hypothetical protein
MNDQIIQLLGIHASLASHILHVVKQCSKQVIGINAFTIVASMQDLQSIRNRTTMSSKAILCAPPVSIRQNIPYPRHLGIQSLKTAIPDVDEIRRR